MSQSKRDDVTSSAFDFETSDYETAPLWLDPLTNFVMEPDKETYRLAQEKGEEWTTIFKTSGYSHYSLSSGSLAGFPSLLTISQRTARSLLFNDHTLYQIGAQR